MDDQQLYIYRLVDGSLIIGSEYKNTREESVYIKCPLEVTSEDATDGVSTLLFLNKWFPLQDLDESIEVPIVHILAKTDCPKKLCKYYQLSVQGFKDRLMELEQDMDAMLEALNDYQTEEEEEEDQYDQFDEKKTYH